MENELEPTHTIIDIKEYENLKKAKRFLSALENAGVDNWGGFEIAQESVDDSPIIPPCGVEIIARAFEYDEALRIGFEQGYIANDSRLCEKISDDCGKHCACKKIIRAIIDKKDEKFNLELRRFLSLYT